MNIGDPKKKVADIQTNIQNILNYDPQIIFSDTFDRIIQQLKNFEQIFNDIIANEKDYWIAYNAAISILPVLEKLVFCGYSDQILEYLLTMHYTVATILIFRTSRFIPFRMQIFSLVAFAMSNTNQTREKDAENFILTFKSELNQLKQLEETNINGLTESIVTCNGDKIVLSDLFDLCFNTISKVLVHFSTIQEIEFERVGQQQNKSKQRPKKITKEDSTQIIPPVPPQKAVEMIINAFGSPLNKQDYLNKYTQIVQSWTNPECKLDIILFHKLLFSFMRCGNFTETDQLMQSFPDDPILKLAVLMSQDKLMEVSELLNTLPKEIIQTDYQFFNEIAMKIYNKFTTNQLDPLILVGVLHVLVLLPSPCPMHVALTALHICWKLDELERYEECINYSKQALDVVNNFRDIFATRKLEKIIAPTLSIPTKPVDKSFKMFEHWLECLHVDLITIWISSQLKFGLINDTNQAKKEYDEYIAQKKAECEKTKSLYGILDANQAQYYDQEINKVFQPPTHSKNVEDALLEQFKSNYAVKALIYIQMCFFRPSKAASFLEKARDCLTELDKLSIRNNSPIIYVNRTQIALTCSDLMPLAKTVCLYGKEVVGNSGLTLANTHLQGCGIKQEKLEPFIVSKLKPNTLYIFAFGGYNAQNELIDSLGKSFQVTTCHTYCNELIWSYIAACAYKTRDLASFDMSLTHLLERYTTINEVSEENQFAKSMNPFDRFLLKEDIINEPAPLIRSFASVLLMASRLLSAKPLHASSFQHISLVLAQILNNPDLVLSAAREALVTLQPLISNTYHTQWIIQPLLFIINSLKFNKKTQNTPEHQEILAKAAYALDSALVKLYQERQLSLYIMNSVLELPQNHWRQVFLLFAAKNQITESTFGNDQTLPYYAAEMFRSSPDKSYDDLFSKFKLDPLFPAAAIYLISAAHNTGMFSQGANWAKQCLEYIKSIVHENEEKPTNKKSSRNQKNPPKKKLAQGKGKSKDISKSSQEDIQMTNAAAKIQQVWAKRQARNKNIQKYYDYNQFRCVLNLLYAMCILENEQTLAHSNPITLDPSSKKDPKHAKQQRQQRQHTPTKRGVEEEQQINFDMPNLFVQVAINAIVLAERCDRTDIMHAASNLYKTFLTTLSPKTPIFSNLAPRMITVLDVLVTHLPLHEQWAKDLLTEQLLFILRDGKIDIVLTALSKAVKVDYKCGMMLWMTQGNEIPEDLQDVAKMLQRRDPAENAFYAASDIINRALPENSDCFPNEPAANNSQILIKSAGDIAVSLQHKQRLSMSISILRRIGFIVYGLRDTKSAVKKWCEALECHFRTVRVHEKVDQVLEGKTEESFYQDHSWAGCISIFVLSAYIAMNSEREQAMQLCRLAAFSLSALFSNTYTNPKKQIDYANYEPAEIVPGVDIFSSYDPKQPLLEPVDAQTLTTAIIYLLSAMETYEFHFELFKPLSFARHFFRFIIREKCLLARVRLATVINCCHFGLLSQAVVILNDVITNFGLPHHTKEFTLLPPLTKRFSFDQSETFSYQPNGECIKFISSQQSIGTVANQFGGQIACQYALCVARLLIVVSEAQNPVVETADLSSSSSVKVAAAPSKRAHRRSHGHNKKDEPLPLSAMSTSSEFIADLLKNAEMILNEFINKEIKPDQATIKCELQLELAQVRIHQWMWDAAIQISMDVIKTIHDGSLDGLPFGDNYLDKSFNLTSGLIATASKNMCMCYYNIHDLKNASKYQTPYMKSLILIHKADYEQAAKLLVNIALSKPLTLYYRDYVLSCAQLVMLFCANPVLFETCFSGDNINPKKKQEMLPLKVASRIYNDTEAFYIEELGLKDEKNLYLRDTQLLIRLQYLVAKANYQFKGELDTIDILEAAQSEMTTFCPYPIHGLSFLLSASAAKIKMQNFIIKNPSVIQYWNKEFNPLKAHSMPRYSPQDVDKMVESMTFMFSSHPDCIVHPASQQTIVDLAVLTGIANDDGKRIEKSFSVLTVANAVRTSKRFIQTLVAQCPDSPAPSCPSLLQNDNKDQTMRQLAASYYAHVCSLDMPLFDTSLLEMRTLLFFKCFEEQCAQFKSLTIPPDTLQEPNYIVGQWYQVDSKYFKPPEVDGGTTFRSGRSTITPSASVFSGTSRATTASGMRKHSHVSGILFFFIGILTSEKENNKSHDPIKYTPISIVGHLNEIHKLSNDMAEIGITIQEANHMEKISGTAQEPKESLEKSTGSKKKSSSKLKSSSLIQSQTTATTTIAPLKGQAEATARNAVMKWSVTSHKLEAILTKSAKILSSLETGSTRRVNDIKINGIEKESATTFSHLFNVQFGIYEKDESVSKWLLSLNEVPSSEAPTPLPQLK